MSLKDYKTDDPEVDEVQPLTEKSDSSIEGAVYHEEINTLKIDKLSNRITIISIIIPCIIGAILVFAYLDMKERVVDVDQTKNTQVERISQQLEEKLNALDVKIAKNKFDLDKQLPQITAKQTAFEGKMTKLAAAKADSKSVKSMMAKVEGKIVSNTKHDKALNTQVATLKKKLDTTLAENNTKVEKTVSQIKEEITLFKEEFDARLLELSNYEQQIGELKKDFSLMDKKVRRQEQESLSQADMDKALSELKSQFSSRLSKFENKITALDKKLAANISRLQKDLDLLVKQSSSTSTGPTPQITVDVKESGAIEEKALTE